MRPAMQKSSGNAHHKERATILGTTIERGMQPGKRRYSRIGEKRVQAGIPPTERERGKCASSPKVPSGAGSIPVSCLQKDKSYKDDSNNKRQRRSNSLTNSSDGKQMTSEKGRVRWTDSGSRTRFNICDTPTRPLRLKTTLKSGEGENREHGPSCKAQRERAFADAAPATYASRKTRV